MDFVDIFIHLLFKNIFIHIHLYLFIHLQQSRYLKVPIILTFGYILSVTTLLGRPLHRLFTGNM